MDSFHATIATALASGYTIERELGGGGMSRTYLAREHALSRRVVIKVLAPELLQGLSVERFKREVLLAAQLQHPHVVPVLSAGDAEGMPWFTMPYVDGESLRRKLDDGPIGLGEAMRILRDVARALAYAHAQGVVHRDIKPDNVLLSGGSATVTDFGIAKAISASRTNGASATLTQAGMAIGTPAYMSPEQAAGDPDLDHRADIYSFGAMAYELLSGQQVFAGLTPARQLVAHLSEAPRDLRELRPEIPPGLSQLVMQCLAKEPSARPADAAIISQVLDSITTSGATGAAPLLLSGGRIPLGKVLGAWAAVTALVILTAWAATEVIGLPDWALAGATGLMLAGLPAIVVTWWVQRTARRVVTATPSRTASGSMAPVGAMATFAIKASPHVSWRRTWRAGTTAVAAFVLLVAGYMVTRAMGIGPAASLRGTGDFGDNETIVVADFRSPADDTLLGITVAEALRTDLGQSENLHVISRASTREILQRMLKPVESALLFPVAREIATREGAKAVIDGEVIKLGGSYVLTARLVSAADGNELAVFRETATGDDQLIELVGTLSRSIRNKVGESLKSIRASSPVERVTTPSLAALKKYMEGVNAEEVRGDPQRAVQNYEAAIALDSGFAMAWRKLSVVLSNNGLDRPKVIRSLSEAWKHRDRLSDEERAITEGSYYMNGPDPDPEKALAAYEQLLTTDSTHRTALNNAATIHLQFRRHEKAEAMLRLASRQPTANAQQFTNLLAAALVGARSPVAFDSIEADFRAKFPTSSGLWEAAAITLFAHDQIDSVETLARSMQRTARGWRQEFQSTMWLDALGLYQGKARQAVQSATGLAVAEARAGLDASVTSETVPNVWMRAAIDSATYAVLLGGDELNARAFLKGAISRSAVDAVAPADRDWSDLAIAAALAGDSISGRIAGEGYRRDVMPTDLWRRINAPRVDAYVALSQANWNGAIQSLALVLKQLGSPGVDDAFYMAMAHDRAGRPDSAIAWYNRAIKSGSQNRYSQAAYWPAAHRRLGELYDRHGNGAKAIEHYEWFADRWKNADPELQPTVKAVRARVAELKAKRAPG